MMDEHQIRKYLKEMEQELFVYSDHGKPSGQFWYVRFEGARDALRKVLQEDDLGKCRVINADHFQCRNNATGRRFGVPRCLLHGGPPS